VNTVGESGAHVERRQCNWGGCRQDKVVYVSGIAVKSTDASQATLPQTIVIIAPSLFITAINGKICPAVCFLLALVTSAPAGHPTPQAALQFQLQIPRNTLIWRSTPADINQAKARAARYVWARESLARCLPRADRAMARPWGVLEQAEG